MLVKKKEKKLNSKQQKQHTMPKKTLNNEWVKPAEKRFVSALSLQRSTPLANRLEDPVRQPTKFYELYPQKQRLLTKESFRCPNSKCNNSYLLKPKIGARHFTFDLKKLALDYLPHIRMDGPLDFTSPKEPVRMYCYLANPLYKPITIQVKPRSNDAFSNTDISCSSNTFEVDKRDPTARVIWPPLSTKRNQVQSGDFTAKNMMGIVLNATSRQDLIDAYNFVLDLNVKCEIITENGDRRKVELRYPLEITVKIPSEKELARRNSVQPQQQKRRAKYKKQGVPQSGRPRRVTTSSERTRQPIVGQDGRPRRTTVAQQVRTQRAPDGQRRRATSYRT